MTYDFPQYSVAICGLSVESSSNALLLVLAQAYFLAWKQCVRLQRSEDLATAQQAELARAAELRSRSVSRIASIALRSDGSGDSEVGGLTGSVIAGREAGAQSSSFKIA